MLATFAVMIWFSGKLILVGLILDETLDGRETKVGTVKPILSV
jgi:hypothetical protein